MKPDSCSGCCLYHLPFVGRVLDGVIYGDGPLDAQIALVGEAPWMEEERERRNFAGKAGSLLTIACGEAGVSRRNCYVTNAVKCVTLQPPAEAVGHCVRAHLLKELARVKPNVVVALGKVAFEALAEGRASVTAWRGHLLDVQLAGQAEKLGG